MNLGTIGKLVGGAELSTRAKGYDRPVLNVLNTTPSIASAVTNVGALEEAGEL